MANVLCQIRGKKRMLLYPPSDVSLFDIAPGASSSSFNPFDSEGKPSPQNRAHAHEGILQPGDILFIPSMWLHAAAPLETVSVSVNVFFRNLETGYAAGRDVYGNRDLQPYEKGRREIDKIAKAFESLPADVSNFYLLRLADELKARAYASRDG